MINLSAVLVLLAVLSHAAAQTAELDADKKRNSCVALCIESYGSNVAAQQTCHAKCLQNGEFDPNLGSDTADVVYYNKCLKNCDTDKDLSPKCPLDCKDHHEAKRLGPDGRLLLQSGKKGKLGDQKGAGHRMGASAAVYVAGGLAVFAALASL